MTDMTTRLLSMFCAVIVSATMFHSSFF